MTDEHIPEEHQGRTMEHAEELGTRSESTQERRAREIARIEGRTEVRPEDRERAAEELRGETIHTSADPAQPETYTSRDPAEVAADTGRRAPERRPADDRQLEEEVAEGVEEAAHDRMLDARASDEEPGKKS